MEDLRLKWLTHRMQGKQRASSVANVYSSSSSSKVQSSMVEYHALVAYGHMAWLSAVVITDACFEGGECPRLDHRCW